MDTIKTNLTPEDKAREVKLLRAQGHTVAVVSNENPDMPALTAADVSVFLQQQNISPLIVEEEGKEREGSHLADIKAELAKIKLDDEEVIEDEKKETPPVAETNDVKIYDKVDIEIPTLKKFLTVHKVALRAADLMKMNRNIAYFSWIVMVPMAIMNALAKPPVYFNPIMAIIGVLICAVLILLNSLRMRKID